MSNSSDNTARCWHKIGVWGDTTCDQLSEVVHCQNCDVFTGAGRELFARPSPEDYLQDWSNRIREVKETNQKSHVPYLIFACGGEWFGLRSALVMEVVEKNPVFPIPFRSNDTLLGLTNYRGDLVPTISLAAIISNTEGEEIQGLHAIPRNLVLVTDKKLWIAPVDHVEGIISVEEADFLPAPIAAIASDPNFTSALLEHKGKTISILDHELLLTHINRNCL